MLMQSETRWSGPPPDLMLTSALVNVLANAILSGEQEKDAIVTRLGYVLGRNWRWVRPLAVHYLEIFHGRTRPRRREVVSFLRLDPDFVEACHQYVCPPSPAARRADVTLARESLQLSSRLPPERARPIRRGCLHPLCG